MTRTVVHNEVSQAERRATLENDQRVRARGATFSQFAISEADIVGGRYGAVSKSTVTGSGPVRYPEQPATSPWHDEQPVEPPLGYDISEAPIVGEPHEIKESLSALREASGGAGQSPADSPLSASPSGGVEAPSGSILPTGSSETTSPPSYPKRRKR